MNTDRIPLGLAALGLFWALGPAALAESEDAGTPIPQQRQERLLERFGDYGIDTNGDGVLTREEVRTFFAARGDARAEERPAWRRGRQALRRGPLGSPFGRGRSGGGDDTPLCAERQGALLERFGEAGIDADGDGTLTHGEVRAFMAESPGAMREGRAGWGRKGHHFGPGTRGRGGPGMDPIGRLLHRLEILSAETPPPGFDSGRFRRVDADEDGQVSAEEWATFADNARTRVLAQLLRMVPEADSNDDGQLSEEEIVTLRTEHSARMRARILANHPDADANGDGTLSDGEFEAFRTARDAEHRTRLLERHPEADLDGDGSLNDEEMRAFRSSAPPVRGKMNNRPERRGGGRWLRCWEADE